MAVGLAWSKIIAMSVMFVVTMAFGAFSERLVAYFRRRGKGTSEMDCGITVTLLNCFAGGLFLGTFLLGLLPEVRELFEDVLVRFGLDVHFPVAEAVTAVGFFLVMFVEHVAEMCQTSGFNQPFGHNHRHSVPPIKDTQSSNWYIQEAEGHQCKTHNKHIGHSKREDYTDSSELVLKTFRYTNEDCKLSMSPSDSQVGGINPGFEVDASHGEYSAESEGNNLQTLSAHKLSFLHGQISNQEQTTEQKEKHKPVILGFNNAAEEVKTKGLSDLEVPKESKSLRSILLVLALSMHTLFEGLALGLLDDEAAIWTLMIAVTVHKSVIVLALGIQLCKIETNTTKMIYLNIFAFAIMSPIGIGIGTAVTETGNPDDLLTDTASSILQGLATGTFLYVTFFEVLNRELEGDPNLKKVLAVILGFCGVIGLKFLEHHGGH